MMWIKQSSRLRQEPGPCPVRDRNSIADHIKRLVAWAPEYSLLDAAISKVEPYLYSLRQGFFPRLIP